MLMLRRGSLRVVRVISQNKKHTALLRHSLCRCFSLEPMSQKTEIFARQNKKSMKNLPLFSGCVVAFCCLFVVVVAVAVVVVLVVVVVVAAVAVVAVVVGVGGGGAVDVDVVDVVVVAVAVACFCC